MVANNSSLNQLHEFTKAYPGNEFKPLAYFDTHLDCIQVQIKDTSFKEGRLNRLITILIASHDDKDKLVGFTIKGIRYLFEILGLPKSGVIKLTVLMDAIVKGFPEETVHKFADSIKNITEVNYLNVTF